MSKFHLNPWELGLCRLRAPELSAVNAKVNEMLEEDRRQPIEREDKPGDDPELRKAMAKRLSRKGKKAEWLPLEVGKAYRSINGMGLHLGDGYPKGWISRTRFWEADYKQAYDESGKERRPGKTAVGDLIGPWAPELEGKTPPDGYQWTGEFRIPIMNEHFTPHPTANTPAWESHEVMTQCWRETDKDVKRWILIKL